MSGVKHTPVELHAVSNGIYWTVSVGPHDYSQSVASCIPNRVLGHGMADAERFTRMFAGAPDLLEAVWALIEHFERVDGDAEHKAVIAKGMAAIARARGEQSQSEKEVGNV